jgi:hypothetical protein
MELGDDDYFGGPSGSAGAWEPFDAPPAAAAPPAQPAGSSAPAYPDLPPWPPSALTYDVPPAMAATLSEAHKRQASLGGVGGRARRC